MNTRPIQSPEQNKSAPQLSPGDDAAPGTPGTGEDICQECSGTGKIDKGAECPNCGGTGYIIEGIGGG
jgi:DnaJ-class molecular chaperone